MAAGEIARSASLLVPAVLVVAGWVIRQPRQREAGGVLLATLWTVPALVLVNAVASAAGWWSFPGTRGLIPIPPDLLIGWMLIWGALPAMFLRRLPLWLVAGGFGWLDFQLMPRLDPALALGRWWPAGELLALVVTLIPAQLLARWTIDRQHLYLRAVLQCVGFASLSIVVLPLAVLSLSGGSLSVGLSRPAWISSLIVEVAAFPAAMGLAAVIEFARRGRGTPFPYDPPEVLVTTGPYAYVRNPMQLSMTLLMFLAGLFLGSPLVMAAAVVAAAFSAGFAAWQESGDLTRRFGTRWLQYRQRVRSWLPSWKPRFAPDDQPAVLYYATTCAACNQVGDWVRRRSPTNLQLRPAESAPTVLRRLTADYGEEIPRAQGTVAFAAAIERINLAWAVLAWMMSIPVVAQVIQLAADALGAGPRTIPHLEPDDVDSGQ